MNFVPKGLAHPPSDRKMRHVFAVAIKYLARAPASIRSSFDTEEATTDGTDDHRTSKLPRQFCLIRGIRVIRGGLHASLAFCAGDLGADVQNGCGSRGLLSFARGWLFATESDASQIHTEYGVRSGGVLLGR